MGSDDRALDATLSSPAPGPALSHIAEALRPLAVPIDQLREMEANTRLHGWRDITALCESLQRFGQVKPVVATRDGAVICGNGTLAAARRLGWSFLAVSWFDGSPALARMLSIADNRTAELSQWDLQQLADDAASVDLTPWWTPTELADLLSSLGTDAPADFQPASDALQGRLDQLAHETTCPACGHRFAPSEGR